MSPAGCMCVSPSIHQAYISPSIILFSLNTLCLNGNSNIYCQKLYFVVTEFDDVGG